MGVFPSTHVVLRTRTLSAVTGKGSMAKDVTTINRSIVGVLRDLRRREGLGLTGFAERLGEYGYRVTANAVKGYEEGRTKKIPLEYVYAVAVAFDAPVSDFFSRADTGTPTDDAAAKLAAIRDILGGGSARASAPRAPLPEPVDVETLKKVFLAACMDYGDLEIEQLVGINHETVRQYRGGRWPERGPNRATRDKMAAMIQIHEASLEKRIPTGGLTPLIEGLIVFVEDRLGDSAFVAEHSEEGAIALAEDAVRHLRLHAQMTVQDELCWAAYKRGAGVKSDGLPQGVTFESLGLDLESFLKGATGT